MEVLYGLNSDGKREHLKKAESNGALILKSQLESWKSINNGSISIEQFADLLSQNNEKIKEIKNEIKSPNALKKINFLWPSKSFNKLMNEYEPYQNIINNFDFSNINDIAKLNVLPKMPFDYTQNKVLDEVHAFISELNEKEYNKIIGATKFFKSIKNKIQKGSENFISGLISIWKDINNFFEDINVNEHLKKLITNGNIEIIKFARSHEPIQNTLVNKIKMSICENIKYIWSKDIDELKLQKAELINKQMTFDISGERIAELKDEFNIININLVDNNKKVEIDGNLSSGEFAILAFEIILNSIRDKSTEIIIDDVLKSFDDENCFKAIISILKYKNPKVLTHDVNIVKIFDKISKEYEDMVEIKLFSI